MKYLSIFFIILLFCSCGGTQKAIKTSDVNKDVATQSKPTEEATENAANQAEQHTDERKFHKRVNVVDSEGNIVGQASSYEEAEALLEQHNAKKKSDSIQKVKSELEKMRPQEGSLHLLWHELLQKHVSNKGNIDYKGFKNSRKELLRYIKEIQTYYPNLKERSEEEKLAYWINAYNALTIDLIIRNYPVKSIKDIEAPWDERLWKFGVKWLNLNDIEHQILRKMDEPRIHFAIVCASVSCPKLQNVSYTGENLEIQLANATREFLRDQTKNQISEERIKISRIFKWFGKDFKTKNSDLIDFLNQYSDVQISDNAKKSYLYYNWNLNE